MMSPTNSRYLAYTFLFKRLGECNFLILGVKGLNQLFFLTDINECSNKSLHKCSQKCVNKPGSYACDCYDGYKLANDGYACSGKREIYYGLPFFGRVNGLKARLHMRFFMRFRCDFAYKTRPSLPRTGL